MATVITVMNMKGGVGKTTFAMHLGGMLARYGRSLAGQDMRVLMIDYDPQFNLSQALIPAGKYFDLQKKRKTSLAILQDDESVVDPFTLQVPGNSKPPTIGSISHTVFSRDKKPILEIVPSTLDLMYVAIGRSEKRVAPMEERFRKFVSEARAKYDVVVIDCHPAGSILTKTSLQNSDGVVIPVAPQKYALRGIGLMMELLGALKETKRTGPRPLIAFNRVPRVGTTAEENEIRRNERYRDYCLTTTLKTYKAFSEPEGGRGFVWSSTKPWATQAFNNLYEVVEEVAETLEVGS